MTEATGQTPAVAAAPVRDARAALIAAAVVAGYRLLEILLGIVVWSPFGRFDSGYATVIGSQFVYQVLPFAAGVLLVLWLWPAAQGEGLGRLIARCAVASVAGATAASIMALVVAGVQAGLGLLRDLGSLGGMFGLPDAAAQILPQALAGAPLVIAVVLVQRLLARGVTRL